MVQGKWPCLKFCHPFLLNECIHLSTPYLLLHIVQDVLEVQIVVVVLYALSNGLVEQGRRLCRRVQ